MSEHADRAGVVERLHLAATAGGPVRAVEQVVAHAGRGLEGDRHFDDPDAGDITLIEAEVLERLAAEHGVDLRDGGSRRQVTTRGVDLGAFVGRRFRVGDVECVGEELCEPCNHLAQLTDPAVLRGLLHSGLRADVVTGGTIAPGDPVVALPD